MFRRFPEQEAASACWCRFWPGKRGRLSVCELQEANRHLGAPPTGLKQHAAGSCPTYHPQWWRWIGGSAKTGQCRSAQELAPRGASSGGDGSACRSGVVGCCLPEQSTSSSQSAASWNLRSPRSLAPGGSALRPRIRKAARHQATTYPQTSNITRLPLLENESRKILRNVGLKLLTQKIIFNLRCAVVNSEHNNQSDLYIIAILMALQGC